MGEYYLFNTWIISLSAISDCRKTQFYYFKQNSSHRNQYLKHATLTFYSPNVHWPECYINTCNSFEQFSVEMLLIFFSRFLSSWQKRNTVYTLRPLGNWKWVLCCSCHWSKQFGSHLRPHINAFDNKLLDRNSQQCYFWTFLLLA